MTTLFGKVRAALTAAWAAVLALIASPGFGNFRATIYTAAPAVLTALVGWGKLSQDNAVLVGALVTAFIGPALAAVNSLSGLRTWFFGVLATLQPLLVGLGVATDQDITPIIAIVTAVVGAGVASANVHKDNPPPASTAPAGPSSAAPSAT